jgi:hypothetical protein
MLFATFVLHAIPISSPWLLSYTWRRVQVMKLLTMQCSQISFYFIPLRSKYYSQHPVRKHPQSRIRP